MENIEQRIAEIIGEASMLWSETPKGVFNSEKAKELCEEIMTHIKYPITDKSFIPKAPWTPCIGDDCNHSSHKQL